MICPGCKANVPDGSAFCGICGCNIAQALAEQAALEQAAQEQTAQAEEIVEQAAEPAEEAVEEAVQEVQEQPDLGECTVDLSQYTEFAEQTVEQQPEETQAIVPAQTQEMEAQPDFAQEYQPYYAPAAPVQKENFLAKLTKKQKILFASIAAALIIAIAGALILINVIFTPEKKLVDYLADGSFDEALDYYSDTYIDDERDTDKLVEALNKRIETLKTDCGSGAITCDRATEELDTIDAMDIPEMDDTIYSAREFVGNVRMSEENYNQGNTYFEAEEYKTAIEYYKLVVEGTPYYSDAQEKMKTATENYKTDIFARADACAEKEDYKQAIEILEESGELLPEDEEIAEKLDDYKKKYTDKVCTDAVANADSKIAAEDYAEAIRILDEAIVEVGEDSRLTSKKSDTQTKYENYVIAKADSYVAQNNYSGAFSVINEALVIMPDNKKILDKKEQIEAVMPMGLDDLKVSECDHFEQVTDLVVTHDVVGEVYSPGNLFIISAYDDGWGGGYSGYGKFFLSGSYTTLSGYIAVADTSDVGECVLTVYGDDDKILYTSPVLSRTTSKIKVDIPVSGVQWINVKLTVNGSSSDMDVLLSEFYLYK